MDNPACQNREEFPVKELNPDMPSIGTHRFEWIDVLVTGRFDGEDYNIGFVDVTDRPYDKLVAVAKVMHTRLFDVHSGKIPPTNRIAKTSEVGTSAEASQLGVPAIQ
jgi:hypothetical protein